MKTIQDGNLNVTLQVQMENLILLDEFKWEASDDMDYIKTLHKTSI
jgi:hypothetical protein